MSLKGAVLWISLFCTTIVSPTDKTNAENEYFSLITDQKETEEKVFSYLHDQKYMFRGLLSAISNMLPNICDIWWEEKSKFCSDILQADDNGFNLAIRYPTDLDCNDASLFIQFLSRSDSESFKLTLFFCPKINFKDLETNQQVYLPNYTYAVSKARDHNSAIMFVQNDSIWYPQHYITNINLKKIRRTSSDLGINELRPQSSKEDIIKLYLEAKQISSPYEKFMRLFLSINICGLRRAHKIHLCRESIKTAFHEAYVKFDLFDYNEYKCKKHRISLLKENENNFQQPNELLLVRCPPIESVRSDISNKRNFFNLYYLASNLRHQSLTLLIRKNERGKIPQQEANIYKLPMQPIIKDIHRRRFLPPSFKINAEHIQHQKSYQEIEDEINSAAGDVQMPITIARLYKSHLKEKSGSGPSLQTSLSKWLADDSVIAFSKVKMITSIYKRFIETYKSIDIGQLSVRQKAALCNDALKYYENPQNIYRFDGKYNFKRSREEVTLTRRDADGLKTSTFILFECPCDLESIYSFFFVGKHHLRDTATIYKRIGINFKNYYYPYAFISGINRYKLAEVVIQN